MATTPKGRRGESVVQVLIMIAVAGMAGAASFTHVHDWTMHNSPAGTGNWFGWANAMVSELIPLAAGLEARRRIRLFGKAGVYPIALIIAAVALSLTGQFAEATPTASGRLIAAVPALGFLALVKLVLSSPAAPTPAPSPEPTLDMPAPTTAIIPAVAIEPIPAHLLATARFAVTNHEQTNGYPITAPELAARLSITEATAATVLHHLNTDSPTRVNGHDLTVVGAR